MIPFYGMESKQVKLVEQPGKNFSFKKYRYEADQDYDLVQIGTLLKANSNYTVGNDLSESSLSVTREFNNVNYSLGFQKNPPAGECYIGISNGSQQSSRMLRPYELPTVPDYRILNNAYQMIDEMPLNDAQKTELKSSVRIEYSYRNWLNPASL